MQSGEHSLSLTMAPSIRCMELIPSDSELSAMLWASASPTQPGRMKLRIPSNGQKTKAYAKRQCNFALSGTVSPEEGGHLRGVQKEQLSLSLPGPLWGA